MALFPGTQTLFGKWRRTWETIRLRAMGLYSRVGLKVSIVDGFDQLFCDLNDLLFPHC